VCIVAGASDDLFADESFDYNLPYRLNAIHLAL
jgi:hypothetical protein